jgi:hypothetical protein
MQDDEFHLRNAPTLCLKRNFSKPNQPLRDVIPPIGSFKGLILKAYRCSVAHYIY